MSQPMVATKQMIEQMFDGAAVSYDRTGPNIFTQFGRRLTEHIPLTPGAHVLDVATGKGAVILPAARCVGTEGHVIGIDLSNVILQEAERALQTEGLTNVELRKMDAEHLEFHDESFDAVICAFALFLFPDIQAAVHEMYRVCKTGGYVGVSVFGKTPFPFNPGWPIFAQQSMAYQVFVPMPQPIAYTPEEVEALLSRSGFRSIATHSETSDIIYSSAEDWWQFLLTLGPRATIMSMNEETRAKFKDEYLTKLRPMFRQDGFHQSVAVIYAAGQR
jgi:ubiquinone/menaquinone biosynthesis C-methylase UbiE